MIHVFHGFLGSPSDFEFLKGEQVVLHDVYELKNYPSITEEDTLIGYSLGGRIAMEIAIRHHFKVKRIVLINAHTGLSSIDEAKEREHFENRIIEKLKTLPKDEFMEFWNRLPIFCADEPIAVTEERYLASAELFYKHRLSGQKDFLPELIQHKDKILFLIGDQDEKYVELAQKKLIPQNIHVKFLKGGHRLFQAAELLRKSLEEENIL